MSDKKIIAVVGATKERPLAEAFVKFALSPEGQRHLADAGFRPAQPR